MTDRDRWNEKYRNRDLKNFKQGPSEWLVKHQKYLLKLPKGPGLDIAAGYGRNSFYAENLGFEMDAVDVSDLAMDWLAEEAKNQGLRIQAHSLDLAQDPFPRSGYQLILCFNFLFRELFPSIKKALLPGGIVLYETVYRDDIKVLGSNMNPNYVLEKKELLEVFQELDVLAYREEIVQFPSGRKKALASIVAQKSN